jgi:UDP-glucuronate 4-epimerase
MLEDRKILVTGATGQIAGPIAENFAKDNAVWCAARFSDPKRKDGTRGNGHQDLRVGYGFR